MPIGVARFVPALLIALLPLSLLAQSPQPSQGPRTADEVIKQEGYVAPPKELADAVLAPRHLNVSLTNLSPDKKWFVDEIGDGPVLMKTFAKPFHELGGVFVDYKANRARALTIRNNTGIQLISASDGTKKPIALAAGTRVSNATWSPDSSGIAFFVHGEDATHIWFADVASGKARQLTKTPVLATLVSASNSARTARPSSSSRCPMGVRRCRPRRPRRPAPPSKSPTPIGTGCARSPA